jgi:Na+-driven multidrug efflux pump
MIISTVSMWIFRVGASYILGKNLGLGVFGVWVAMIIDWAFRSLLFGIRYFSGKWKKHALVS